MKRRQEWRLTANLSMAALESQEEVNRYAAFISYRHRPRDRHWAGRILTEIETFSVPRELQAKGYPKRFGRLFRDEDELAGAPDLPEKITAALDRSDALIVVCSPDTPGSDWVAKEIAYFQRLGRGDRIIPVLIAGELAESLPQQLRVRLARRADLSLDPGEIWEKADPLAINVQPREGERTADAERRAFLKIAATLLGCEFNDLARRDEERRRNLRRRWAASAAALAAAAVAGGAVYWDQNWRLKTEVCANIAFVWALPECVGPLTADEWSRRSVSFRISRKAGRVERLEKVDGDGGPTQRAQTSVELAPWYENAAIVDFDLSQDGRRVHVATFEDAYGNVNRKLTFQYTNENRTQAIAISSLQVRDALTEQTEAVAETAKGTFSRPGDEDNEEQRSFSNIARSVVDFDAAGRLDRRVYRTAGNANTHDGAGVYGVSFKYLANGLVAERFNLGKQLTVDSDRFGIAAHRYEYDHRGNLITTAYADTAGNLVANDRGYAIRKNHRDPDQNIGATLFLDEHGQPVPTKDEAYARGEWKYDASGNPAISRFFDAKGSPVINMKFGAAEVRARHDAKGRLKSIAYFGIGGVPVNRRGFGVHGIEWDYDITGKTTAIRYFDTFRRPTLHAAAGIAEQRNIYDDNGQLVRVEHRGKKGELKRDTKWRAATVHYRYENGQRRSSSYRGPDGKPALFFKVGAAKLVWEYDVSTGNVAKESYFGLDGRPIASREFGVPVATWNYGPDGNESLRSFADGDGTPTPNKEFGAAHLAMDYDARGNRKTLSYLDPDRVLTLRKTWGVATIRSDFDGHGRRIKTSYFDQGDFPTMRQDTGYAVMTMDFQPGGVEIERYFDAEGNRVAWRGDTMARTYRHRDQFGREVIRKFFDTADKPTLSANMQVAAVRTEYDERGNLIAESYFDELDRPKARQDMGIFRRVLVYDSLDREIERRFFGPTGQPAKVRDWRVEGARYFYDDEGRQSAMEYIDAAGKPAINPTFGVSRLEWTYDEFNNNISTTYRSPSGEVTNRQDTGVARYKRLHDLFGRLISEAAFDADGQPVGQLPSNGATEVLPKSRWVHRTQWDHDQRGNVIAIRQFDRKNMPTNGVPERLPDMPTAVDPEGEFSGKTGRAFSQAKFFYDERDNVTEADFFLADEHGGLVALDQLNSVNLR